MHTQRLFKHRNLLPLLSFALALLLSALLLLLSQTGVSSAAGMVATPERAASVEAAPSSPCFTAVNVPFGGVSYSSVAWADYDNDGDPDLVILGERTEFDEFNDAITYHETRLYRSDNGTLVDSEISLVGASNGTVTWGDYDGDSYLDLLITGQNNESDSIIQLYRNVENGEGGRTFTKVSTPFEDEYRWGSAAWADYDNDGDPDLVVSGFSFSDAETFLYRNDSGVFVKQEGDGYTFKGVSEGKMAWADYDGDGAMDLFIAGRGTEYWDLVAILYRNDNGKFIEQTGDGYTFPEFQNASVTWADYDKDNDLDLIIAGATSGGDVFTKLYRNDNGSFIDSEANLAGFVSGDMAWGDYDNDGDLDLMIAGSEDGFDHIAKLYRNDGGNLTEQTDVSTPAFPGTRKGSVAWADYDGDNDLDLLITGYDNSSNQVAVLYRNEGCTTSLNVPDGDVAALIAALNTANAMSTQGTARQSSSAVVNLAANGTYTLTAVDNTDLGGNGLPVITGTVTINGNGATIARSSAAETPIFRILRVRSGANLTLRDLTLTNGVATGDDHDDNFGGGINIFGALTLERTRILSNTAGIGGGGLMLGNGPAVISDTLIAGNSTAGNTEGAGGGLQVQAGVVELTAVTIENNRAPDGGGLTTVVDNDEPLHLIINRSIIRNNTATGSANPLEGTGGGIRLSLALTKTEGSSTVVTVNDTLISNNTAINGGGIGMGLVQPGAPHLIQLTLNRSAVVNNQVQGTGVQQGNGGGILNVNAALHLVNSTISGNTASGNPQVQFSGVGGGIANGRTGLPTTVTMTNTSVISNTALAGGGILNALAAGTTPPVVNFANSLIAGNTALGGVPFGPSCLNQGGTLTSLGHNLDQNNTCGFTAAGDQVSVDPMVGALADNGGPTPTHALLDNSPAIDAADSARCPATDQRGEARPVGEGCDIGAYEGGTRTVENRIYLPMTQR